MRNLRPQLNYANVMATIAVFVAFGGAAVAAGLPKHSIGPRQLKRGAVRSWTIAHKAVTSGKLARKSVVAGKLGPNAVLPWNLPLGVVNTAKLGDGSVISRKMRNGVVTTNKLKNGGVTTAKLAGTAVTTAKLDAGAVTTGKLADGSVTLGKLAPDVPPLLAPLHGGQTLRGVFDLGGDTDLAREGISFQFPLQSTPAAPEANVLGADSATAACPGMRGAAGQTPEAAPGQLCVYVRTKSAKAKVLAFDPESISGLGFGLKAEFEAAAPENLFQGFWAVTAP